MKFNCLLVMVVLVLSGCASTPPMPPEPSGPMVKANIHQPHETFGGN